MPIRQRRPRVAVRGEPRHSESEAKWRGGGELILCVLLLRGGGGACFAVAVRWWHVPRFPWLPSLPPPDDEALASAYHMSSTKAAVTASSRRRTIAACTATVVRVNDSV